MRVEDWDFVLRLNLRSTFLCTRAAVPHMIRQKHGRIVCMSSGAREGTPWTAYYQGGSAYSAAKAGVHGFVRDVALELAEHRINVNAVAPGPIDTERFGPGLRRLNETVEYSPNHMTPLRRLGEPFEVAHAVLFLASDEASYVTGALYFVDGGTTIIKGPVAEEVPEELRREPEPSLDLRHSRDGLRNKELRSAAG
jgi:3-oxoacyl-[acyl-carrier protein] reductase